MKGEYFIKGETIKLSKQVRSIKQKREIVERDEQDSDIRRALQIRASEFLQEKQS